MTQLLGSFSISALGRRAYLRGNTRRQYTFTSSAAEADVSAIREGWDQVGNDLRSTIDAAAEQRLSR